MARRGDGEVMGEVIVVVVHRLYTTRWGLAPGGMLPCCRRVVQTVKASKQNSI